MPLGTAFVPLLVDGTAGVAAPSAPGDAAAVESAFFGLNHACLAGDGEAAAGDPAAVAVVVVFLCLCLPVPGVLLGLGLDVALTANAVDTEKAANAIMRGMSFFIFYDLSLCVISRQPQKVSVTDTYESTCPPYTHRLCCGLL